MNIVFFIIDLRRFCDFLVSISELNSVTDIYIV